MSRPDFAIGIWVDDKKVGGSVLPVDKMRHVDPKLTITPSDLKEGDIVKAKCKGFPGLHRCVIGKIGYEGKDKKEEFGDIIDSPVFQELVQKYGSKYRPELGQITLMTDQQVTENHADSIAGEISNHQGTTKKAGAKQKANKERINLVQSCELESGYVTDTYSPSAAKKPCNPSEKNTKSKSSQKNTQKNLEAVASELELTELALAVSSNERSTNDVCNLVNGMPTSSLLRNSLEIINPQIDYPSTSAIRGEENCRCDCKTLDQDIVSLRSELSRKKLQICTLENKVQSLENTISSLWGWTSQLQQDVRFMQQQRPSDHANWIQHPSDQSTPKQPTIQSEQAADDTDCNTSSQGNAICQEDKAERVIAGFTIAQLECKIAQQENASKAAVLLFRTLFQKKEEYVGKTLTGIAGKPAVDPERLNVIYDIVQRKFGWKPSQIGLDWLTS